MTFLRYIPTLVVLLVFTGVDSAKVPESAFNKNPWPAAKEGPVKVFILAGQSNMKGHASLRTLEYLIYNEETAKEYEQWKDRDGRWIERRDVWVWTTDGKPGATNKTSYLQKQRIGGFDLTLQMPATVVRRPFPQNQHIEVTVRSGSAARFRPVRMAETGLSRAGKLT